MPMPSRTRYWAEHGGGRSRGSFVGVLSWLSKSQSTEKRRLRQIIALLLLCLLYECRQLEWEANDDGWEQLIGRSRDDLIYS